MRLHLSLLTLVFLSAVIVGIERQIYQPVPASSYVGDEECLSCHKEQKTFLRTAHHLTSQPADRDSIAGRFDQGQNVLKTSEPELRYRMEIRNDGFYQTALLGSGPDTASISKRFDLVVGSGRKGQTYLYWEGDQLYQLPVSYWSKLGKWVHSPGYDDRLVNFRRPVSPRCLECHASSFESVPDSSAGNRYNKSNYVLGISCERCHGPGKEHIAINQAKPAKPSAQAIVNPAKLSRERQIGLCALCHGGLGVAKAPAFSYTAGEDLKSYLQLEVPSPTEVVDVHGNQVALLERSRCFQFSTMTCSTCHNPHIPQRDILDFSERCLTCHKVQNCGLFPKLKHQIVNKCVNCHLPELKSKVVVSSHEGLTLQPEVRSHWIKVYPTETFRNRKRK
jgi:hypothetical protein